ncbi:MAG: hypothetical protein CL792_01880 [Chloroflexi bacterium]|nr:hypothetical protein [Chloroflexota bacterium]
MLMFEIIRWYIAICLIGLLFIPVSHFLFNSMRTIGIFYTKSISLSFLALITWWIGWSRVFNYDNYLLWVLVSFCFLANVFLYFTNRELFSKIIAKWKLILVAEIVFLVIFILLALIRIQTPNAENTEKPMDLMMLISVNRTDYFPPLDPWLSGEEISYYHLGHLGVDIVSRISFNQPEVAFNLGLAMIGAMVGVAIFGLSLDIFSVNRIVHFRSQIFVGFTAVVSLLWLGPLAGFYNLVKTFFIVYQEGGSFFDEWWWWWHATRILEGPIVEFPAFSLILGDLHAHVLALPLSIVAIAIVVKTYINRSNLSFKYWLNSPLNLVFIAMIYAALFCTNSWDVISYGFVWFGVVFFLHVRNENHWSLALLNTCKYMILPVILALIFASPFILNLESPSISLGVVNEETTGLRNLLLIWLVPVLPIIVLLFMTHLSVNFRIVSFVIAIIMFLVTIFVFIQIISGDASVLFDRGNGWLALVLIGAVIVVTAQQSFYHDSQNNQSMGLIFLLVALAFSIIFLTELFNIVTGTPGRFNTVFKIWYHVWTLLAVAGSISIGIIVNRLAKPLNYEDEIFTRKNIRYCLPILSVCFLIYGFSYIYAPMMALSRGYEDQKINLDAVVYLKSSDPGLYGAISYAKEKLSPQEHVLLQAITHAYGKGGYLAAASGIPTILNWPGHQIQWRGPELSLYDRVVAVDQIYSLGSSNVGLEVAKKYRVTHIYIGREEKKLFGWNIADRFKDWDIVWKQDNSVIIKVP